MKRIIALLNMLLILVLTGCSGENEATTTNGAEVEQDTQKESVETVDKSAETNSENESVTEELTDKDLRIIVNNAMNNTGDYQAKRVLTYWIYVHDREFCAFDKDYTLVTDVLFDDDTQTSYCKGVWENLVIDPWTGTTSSGEVEEYFFPGESDDLVYIYDTGIEGETHGESSRDYNNISTYCDIKSDFELVEETETEYVIRSYLEYITILEIVNEYAIGMDERFPVTFTIDKETNQIHHIQWKFEYVDTSDLIVEMNMEITPMEDVTVERP